MTSAKHKGIVIVISLLVIGISAYLLFMQFSYKHHYLNERTRDLMLLREVWTHIPFHKKESITIDSLINELKNQGMTLSSPLAIDKNKPCYRVIPFSQAKEVDSVIIEENDNVKENPYHARVYLDGHIGVTSPLQPSKSLSSTKEDDKKPSIKDR
jgi:hypothetical protein